MTKQALKQSASSSYDPFSVFEWQLAHGRIISLGSKAVLMGVVNVTPDSFSDGGRFFSAENAIKQARKLVRAGARIIDIGGESSRPGASETSAQEEQDRILPVIRGLEGDDILVSVDTWRASTAKAALDAGAHIVNDIWGLQRDPELANVVAQHNAGVIIMHTGRNREKLDDVIDDQLDYFRTSLKIAHRAKISVQSIVLDPGFGFAKETTEENLELLNRMDELFALGFPLLTGTSRKRFIAAIAGKAISKRDYGTAATSFAARMKGSAIFRVHDVVKNRAALAMADALLENDGSIKDA